jgi:hypothetical protein
LHGSGAEDLTFFLKIDVELLKNLGGNPTSQLASSLISGTQVLGLYQFAQYSHS